MPIKSKKAEVLCQEHHFSLKPLKYDCYLNQAITCGFCDQEKFTSRLRQCRKNHNQSVNYPIFNKDLNYGTPSFILPTEKYYFVENGMKLNRQHQKKIVDYTDSKSQLYIPKPKSKHNYCSVCRDNYDDYLKHINSDKHKKKIHISSFNKHILELTQKFENKTHNSADNPQIIDDDENQIETMSTPKKRVKQQNYFNGMNVPNVPPFQPNFQFNHFHAYPQFQFPPMYFNPCGMGLNININPYNMFSPFPQMPYLQHQPPQFFSQYRNISQLPQKCIVVQDE